MATVKELIAEAEAAFDQLEVDLRLPAGPNIMAGATVPTLKQAMIIIAARIKLIDAAITSEEPEASTESASGTVIPPADKIVDQAGHAWTFGAAIGSNRKILIDGASAHGDDYGAELLYFARQIYTREGGSWWLFSPIGERWRKVSDPRPVTPGPVDPPPTPNTPKVLSDFTLPAGDIAASARVLVAQARRDDGTQLVGARLVYASTHAPFPIAGVSFEISGTDIFLRTTRAVRRSELGGAALEVW